MEKDVKSDEAIKKLETLLSSGIVDKIVSFTKSPEYSKVFKQRSWEFIPVICKRLNKNTLENNKRLFELCEDLLEKVCREGCAEEAILEIIEQAEKGDDAQFSVIVRCMHYCLVDLKKSWANPVEWCINTIMRHLGCMEVPEDRKFEEEERILMDNDAAAGDIRQVYKSTLEFYRIIIEENQKRNDKNIPQCKEYTLKSLIKLFGRPLAFTDMEVGKTKSDYRIMAEGIMDLILKYKIDILTFLDGSRNSKVQQQGNKEDDQNGYTFLEWEFETTSLGVYFYLIFHEGVGLDAVPHVYNPTFIVDRCVRLSYGLLGFSHTCVQRKGLLLASAVLGKIEDRSLTYHSIDYTVYAQFMEALTGVMIYSDVKVNRRAALDAFHSLLYKLDSRGRYVVLLNIQDVVSQSGFVGHLATIVKDLLAGVLSGDKADQEFFTGKHLHDLLKKLCHLEKGAESDLLQLADRLISCLNLLRFAVLRDSENMTGVWDVIPKLERDFLEPMKRGLELSRAHYKLQKTQLSSGEDGAPPISVEGLTDLPSLPPEQRHHLLDSALNMFDLIDSLLSRLNECIQVNKTK